MFVVYYYELSIRPLLKYISSTNTPWFPQSLSHISLPPSPLTMTRYWLLQNLYAARQGLPMLRHLSRYSVEGTAIPGVQFAAIEQDPSLASRLQGSEQSAFPGMLAVRPSVHGYRVWSYQIHAHPERGGIAVEEAAIALTKVVRRAYNDLVQMECLPGGWPLGPGGITFDQLYLVDVYQVSRGSIQLDLTVELPELQTQFELYDRSMDAVSISKDSV